MRGQFSNEGTVLKNQAAAFSEKNKQNPFVEGTNFTYLYSVSSFESEDY